MKKLGLNEIRELFLDFYSKKDHLRHASFPLIPETDKSLLIVNSGMAPLKPYFSGQLKPPAARMVTCQKCIRTADIENVGFTSRHGTFFEMLGSFSFGDYFKRESINWGWEFLTEVLDLPQERIWVSVYEEDDEAYDIWSKEIGFPKERIVKLGKEHNFWEIGTGPCGPCSEIYFDMGEEHGCGEADCKPGCDCDRFVEFWNHVFTQFSKQEDGSYVPLEHPNIDTGMGLERIACVMQGVSSIFDVDTIKKTLEEVCKIANIEYETGNEADDISLRIITDHIRSATFMIGDKIVPSNEGRGYVLRRLIRRAVRHGKKLGIEKSFLGGLADSVIDIYHEAYPELEKQRVYIKKIIENEEKRFEETLHQGLSMIDEFVEEIKAGGGTEMKPEHAFKLHDTYGFPFEITEEILSEQGISVDRAGFDACMAKQKAMGRAAIADRDEGWRGTAEALKDLPTTEFVGYEELSCDAEILKVVSDEEESTVISEGDEATVVMDKTVFYSTSGGQESDMGCLVNDGMEAEVLSVKSEKGIFLHGIRVIKGSLSEGDSVTAKVDRIHRNNTARNHSCTHLMHQALKDVLGDHVEQAGSQVDASSIRFDFSHFEAMTDEEILEVEKIVNEKIDLFLPIKKELLSIDEAKERGAIGLFEDKYGDEVRVVTMGDYSCELCGGTHLENTGQIGAFKILSESGIAAGTRRIEAVTARSIAEGFAKKDRYLDAISHILKIDREKIIDRLESMQDEIAEMKSNLEAVNQQNLDSLAKKLVASAEDLGGVKLIVKLFDGMENKDMNLLSDKVKEGQKKLVLVSATKVNGKTTLLISATDDLVKEGFNAGKFIKEVSAVASGRGGGRPNMAQAGIPEQDKIKAVFSLAKELLSK